MSHAVLDAFPRRPIALAGVRKDRKSRLLWLLGALLLLLVPLYVGYEAWRRTSLRAELNARGLSADVIEADGSCTYRRGVTLGCTYQLRYRLRPEEGGGERQGTVYVPGSGPRVFAPPARYDPLNPDRIMSEADLARGEPVMNVAMPIGIFGLLSALCLLVWYAIGKPSLTRAAAAPRPALVPITRTVQRPKTTIVDIWYERPGGGEAMQGFANGMPFTVQSGDRQSALALLGPKDKPILLRQDLSELELTDEERAAILAAARG